jgi:FKBP-type peptidyl-prolyl cis-trans isomerase 2
MTARTLLTTLKMLVMIMLLLTVEAWAQEPKTPGVIQKGTTVSLEYTLLDEQGVVIETNKGGNRAIYVQGHGQLIPGVDRALEGMRVGEKKTLKLKPEDAYGQVNPTARFQVPRAKIPAELATPGTKVLAYAGRQVMPGRVQEIRQDTVVVDGNHPLAGKMITVEFEVIDIIAPVQKPQLPVS